VALDPAKLSILHYPHPALRAKAAEIPRITEELKAVALRMVELMHAAPGVGLAAPQVGLGLRLFVANPTGQPADDAVFINPTLAPMGRDLSDHEEGCLSLPEIRGIIRRPKVITITALNLSGQSVQFTDEDLAARIWQHEYDHLDGILIIDRMAPLDRLATQKALRELERAAQE
jgi:peptide deformylase